jgi:hypothetical protein
MNETSASSGFVVMKAITHAVIINNTPTHKAQDLEFFPISNPLK